MASPTTPVAAASAAAPPPAAAPAAAPSSTPVSTPAPASTPSVSTPAAATPAAKPGLSTEQHLQNVLKDRLQFDENGKLVGSKETEGETIEQIAAENEIDPNAATAVEEPAAEGEEAAEAQAETPAEDSEESLVYRPEEGIGARDLAAKIDASPELKAALEANPELRNQVFANARRAARAAQYEEVFVSPDEARVAAQAHGTFSDLQGLLAEGHTPEGAANFIGALLQQSVMRDEDGNVLLNADGKPRTSGVVGMHYNQAFKNFAGNFIAKWEQEQKDDPYVDHSEQIARANAVMESFGLRAASSPDEDDIPEQVRQQREALNQRQQELDQREMQQKQEAKQRFQEGIEAGTQAEFDKELNRFLQNADGLDDHNRATVIRNIKIGLAEALQKSRAYSDEYDALASRAIGPKTQQAYVALNLKYLRNYLAKAAEKPLMDAGVHLTGAQKRAEQKQAARVDASRGDTRGALGAQRPGGPMDGAQLRTFIKDQLVKAGNPHPPETAILAGIMQYRQKLASAAR